MFTVIAIILIFVGLAIVGFVVGRKFSLLSNIDVTQIAAEKQAEVKRRIIHEKFKRQIMNLLRGVNVRLKPLMEYLIKGGRYLYNRLVKLKDSYDQPGKVGAESIKRAEVLLAEADDYRHKGDAVKAESLLIEAIGLDAKNVKAFQALGELYVDRGDFQEAEETLQHAIRLLEQQKKRQPESVKDNELSESYFHLSLSAVGLDDYVRALSAIQQALDLEPNNPRYLDKACEICLNLKDVNESLNYCRRLEKANPGNKKLKDIKEKIRELQKDNNGLAEDIEEVQV